MQITKTNIENDWKTIILDLSTTQEERIQAAFHLENTVDETAIKILAEAMLTDPSPIVRHECAFSLGETAHSKLAAQYLMKAVEEDENIFVRHEALLALGTLGKEEFIPFVKRFLSSSEPEIAESAEIALQRIQNTLS